MTESQKERATECARDPGLYEVKNARQHVCYARRHVLECLSACVRTLIF
jgi:hypothetical protein